jgi:hypothetical protein
MSNQFIIPNNPTPKEIIELTACATNTLALVAEKLARYKNVLADAEDYLKQIQSEKLLLYMEQYPKANQLKLKALVDVDADVKETKKVYKEAKAKVILTETEYKTWDNRFVCLRKIASIMETELKSIR